MEQRRSPICGRHAVAATSWSRRTRTRHASSSRTAAPSASSTARHVASRRRSAKGEVIVSGGVYGSPQLLLLSGIGPGAHLKEMGIDVVHDLPPVGANLHDHFNTYVAWRSTKTGTFNELHRSPFRQACRRRPVRAWARRAADGHRRRIAGILTRTDPRFDRPDLQINTYLWSIETRDHTGMHPHKWPGFSMSPVHLRPEGRGRVSLKSRDPLAPPKIEFKFLETAHDIDAMLYGVRLARKTRRTAGPQRPMSRRRWCRGPTVQSEDKLIEDIRNRGVSNLHPVGTCRMGTGARRSRRSAAAGPWHQGLAGRRCLHHAASCRRQHQCALDHDRREVRRHGARGCGTGVIGPMYS